jgi:hypothetical protein
LVAYILVRSPPLAFCESRSESYLPAAPKTIRAFIEDRVRAGKKSATVKRYVATIARVHIAAGLLNPCASKAVRHRSLLLWLLHGQICVREMHPFLEQRQ